MRLPLSASGAALTGAWRGAYLCGMSGPVPTLRRRRHAGRRRAHAHDLARADGRRGGGARRRRHRPDAAAASLRDGLAALGGRRCARDPRHAGARRAADRGDGGLWRRARGDGGRLRRGGRGRLRAPRGDAADRDQPALGARPDARGPRQSAARRAAAHRLGARGAALRGGCRDQPGHRPGGARPHPRRRRREAGRRAGQRPDQLQRRMARDGGLGHRDRSRHCASSRRSRARRCSGGI